MAEQNLRYYNIVNYAEDNQYDISVMPFNVIDGLVLSQIANVKFKDELSGTGINESITINEACIKAKQNKYLWEGLSFWQQRLFERLAESRRFSRMELSNYVVNPALEGIDGFHVVSDDAVATEQFGAVTVSMGVGDSRSHYMTFRATDGSLQGWNENFAMLYEDVTQAQADAVSYINIVSKHLSGSLMGGGHSKGGNNFAYGFMNCDENVRARFTGGYLYDSPGFNSFNRESGNYEKLQQITGGHFICPQNSIVGMLLNENSNAVFIHSTAKGFLGHDPFTWVIEHLTDAKEDKGAESRVAAVNESWRFMPDKQTEFSKQLNEYLDKSVLRMSAENKRAVFDFVNFILFNSGIDKFDDLGKALLGSRRNSVNTDVKIAERIIKLLVKYEAEDRGEQAELIDAVGILVCTAVEMSVAEYTENVVDWIDKKLSLIEAAIDLSISILCTSEKCKESTVAGFFAGVKKKAWEVYRNMPAYQENPDNPHPLNTPALLPYNNKS